MIDIIQYPVRARQSYRVADSLRLSRGHVDSHRTPRKQYRIIPNLLFFEDRLTVGHETVAFLKFDCMKRAKEAINQ